MDLCTESICVGYVGCVWAMGETGEHVGYVRVCGSVYVFMRYM